jgi:hypothetical protein
MSSAPGAQPPSGSAAADAAAAPEPQHDFSVQKEVHRQIRNDPDYDDWEYGTEPLPQESWRGVAGGDGAAPPPEPLAPPPAQAGQPPA